MEISFEKLKDEAKNQGLPIVGVLEPLYFTELKERLNRFVYEGYHFAFNNQDIEEKCNPFITMKNCKTIVVLGLPYFTVPLQKDQESIDHGSFRGRLSRTAWGEDYHRVFHRKMEKIADFLKKIFPDIEYQCYVDTGPLVDRFLASKANLGFYGYNNLFYHTDFGSYVFYGYMLIDREVENFKKAKDQAEINYSDFCEKCRRCIQVCPGEAIEKPYRVNASRCVSGILQKKGIMPDEDKVRIGNRIYGCDECQEVCPYNKKLKHSSEKVFIPINPSAFPDLIELITLSNKEFKKIYGKNASAWRGARVLKRNALIVLGNLGDQKAIPHMIPFLEDSREDLKDAAQWSINKLRGMVDK